MCVLGRSSEIAFSIEAWTDGYKQHYLHEYCLEIIEAHSVTAEDVKEVAQYQSMGYGDDEVIEELLYILTDEEEL